MEGAGQNQENRPSIQGGERSIVADVFFRGNGHFAFIYKKTEKLAMAIYMITDLIKDNEPLKWKLRDDALELMSLNLDFAGSSLAERRDLLREYQALALEAVALAGIANSTGLISDMNFEILSREFGNLVATIESDEYRRARGETIVLDPNFFETMRPSAPAAAPVSSDAQSTVLYQKEPVAPKGPSKTSASAPLAQVKDAPAPRQKDAVKVDSKDSRQSVILRLLSKKGGLGIKDFAANIKGVSEKTIQRELLAMVAAGILKKEGERRWSTYSLAS